ncbi:glutamate synthase large subunit [Amphiplicatus metriothermophilus]|uniref:Glutamate synthase (NADPH) large subunit n=1 Tax=Amphiplicatus metriothermophilus TaxID=1519374 RepID=A0A239PKX7_9PROT|nr:glutamate synthase large subunit [Amphiplicatus metriothermophilus]MBB5517430.1 glutamate synthase (NADPH/NADH) large chain [Amphiplicatus metriothermophilus]SNT68235.1 glutamate synthase (NADPH) large subunit [Amphiplicatus metriothermophilus]
MSALTWEEQLRARKIAQEAGLWSPEDERDACGVGLIVALDAIPRREIVDMAIRSLKAVWHRGAVDADGRTGDGAGVRLNLPQDLFKAFVRRTGHEPARADVCVGQMFLPRTDFAAQDLARAIVESEILRAGFILYGWRQVPVEASVLGAKANATRPEIEQVLFYDPQGRDREARERALYIVRRRIEKRALAQNLTSLYICSFSSDDIVYKGMFLAQDIDAFYPDLKDERFVSRVAIFHQRYSTNTFPEWRLAQPFRMLAHNGEINTLKGNVNWMKSHEIRMASEAFGADGEDVKPVIQPGSSDSGALDQVFEVLARAGRSGPMVKSLLIPEAWSKREAIVPKRWRALYEYCNAVMEPWDGPAAIAAYDGRWAIAGLDRNGLRPMRYAITEDGVLAVGSETGMCPLSGKTIKKRGALEPGAMIAFDFEEKKFYTHAEILDHLSAKHPYEKWIDNILELEPHIGPGPEDRLFDTEETLRRQTAAGYSLEELDLVLRPMAEDGKEAIGSMGDDTPLAVLSKKYRPLSHYFRQKFSQVTNPPIDPLREARVMSLKTRFKNLGNILVSDETQTNVYVLESPFLSNGMFERFRDYAEDAVEIDCTYPAPAEPGSGAALRGALDRIRAEAEKAVRDGAQHVILSDLGQGRERLAAPMILAAGGVHAHLTRKGLRTFCSIIVRSAECVDPHYMAVLVGVGATAVNPYLACESIALAHEKGLYGSLTLGQCILNYKRAIEAGLLKILSKSGISVISAYRGGCNFEALGLSRALAAEFFPGVQSRISGIGLPGLEKKTAELHARAFGAATPALPIGGFYRHRRRGELHALEATLIHELQKAVREEDYEAYKRYSAALAAQPPVQLRDLLGVRPLGRERALDDVESANAIRKRFVTPGMSLGALSPEAHGALNVAMNRIGAKSVSGEGGEDRARYKPLPNGDNANSAVKQIASGRFGVTAEYLNQCREIEIKVAQGAKPGEGGQLPGFKVTEMIAKLRHATPGVTLISPPPHHDIYSIEDLAQLIYDLKNINPDARVCVKLVSTAGVGTIAAGVAKAKADVILISGHVGGTGASPLTSIKYAGSPWEIGLSEAHQVLTLNNLRESVTLRTDGGIRTGRDVVIAAMLGAEEFGIGTISLVAMGCLMVRQCHSNTCPVGVCTQDEDLRRRFRGAPEHVVTLMSFIAEETREILASLGAASLEDVIGRADLLDQVHRGAPDLDDLDLNPILTRVDAGGRPRRSTRAGRNEPAKALDEEILADAAPVFERGEKMQLTYAVRNVHRAVGARLSSAIVRKFGPDGLADGHLTVRLRGSAGQSLGAFAAKGLRLEVDGDANDYVGKGLSGATIVIRPPADARQRAHEDAIIGNTCLYGATSGALFAAGRAGGRFAVRNSGATAVIEGCSANGCEYMTGGTVVILGSVGDNFAAGMTGGRAYVLDEDGRFRDLVNDDSVVFRRFDEAAREGESGEEECLALIRRHAEETRSARAEAMLKDWDAWRGRFFDVIPREILALKRKGRLAAAE